MRRPPPTSIRIRFNEGNATPVAIESQNIWRWYALDNVFQPIDRETNKPKEPKVVCNLFLVFEEPTRVAQVRIDATGAPLPPNEVKDRSERHVVVAFYGGLSRLVLNVQILND